MDRLHEVEEILKTVRDPEIPMANIVDLGMVDAVDVDDEHIFVRLMPTFVGCPAQRVIIRDVEKALRDHFVLAISVEMGMLTPWTSDRITEEGRAELKASGIAPPGATLDDVACPFCGSEEAVRENLFASTSCRSLFYCKACRNPFEAFKPI